MSLAFEQLRFSTEQLSEGGRDTTLTTFASKWLLPRLGSFRPAHPDIDIRIGASTDLVDFVVGGSDVGIRYGHGNWKGLRCDRLMGDEILPVCSPSLMAEGQRWSNLPIWHITPCCRSMARRPTIGHVGSKRRRCPPIWRAAPR
ncbi:LysR substrate-binding domain-containing protein [Burkholderia gladioli]|uniref:LysR substrate-binding domain-containing protein n=1 Tax=Burkholderia gladioli TaxID=28095 RepID=UPI002FE07D1A